VDERLRGQLTPGADAQLAALRQLVQQEAVALGIHHHGDVGVVLGRGPDHGRPADVDRLDQLLVGNVAARRQAHEGVQVDDQEVDRLDAVLGQRRRVVRHVATRQEGPVHVGVQRLDPPAEHLGDARDVLHLAHGQAVLLQEGGGAGRGDELHAELGEALRERLEPGLVGHREEGSLDLELHGLRLLQGSRPWANALTASGSRRCSTA
jgi:hypothetical protein